MARLLIAVIVGLLLFGGVLAADQMLQNPDVVSEDPDTAAQQETFAEATAPFVRAAAPVALFALVIGSVLVAVRAVGAA